MATAIQPLPSEVVHLIAAGEVIDSLAAVVRELVENSLDAGATRIVVSLWPELWRVRVSDNGCGMNAIDLQQAAAAHTTSKIRNCEDLWKITSLGFRGEALHSLTTLAELEILSRTTTAGGWRVVYDCGGNAVAAETAAIAPGTVVTVSNLFANWSERRQGLPSVKGQMKAVQETIQQIALCHPHVTWQVWQNDRQWFAISPSVNTQQLLPQFLRQVHTNDLQQLQVEVPNSSLQLPSPHSGLSLVLGLPDRCHRHRPDWVRVAVNGRMVKSPELEQTILAAFARTLPRDRYPVCFLHLAVPPDQINWNRHPAKAEIYLHSMSSWQEQISSAINQALHLNTEHISEAVHNSRIGKLFKVAEDKPTYSLNRPPLPPSPTPPSPLHFLKAIAQVQNTYIVAEHPGGIWLVEQHIAHERVLYEQLSDAWQLVTTENPILLPQLSTDQVVQLQRIGLDIELFGEQLWVVRTVPAMLQHREDCKEALLELSLGGDMQTAQVAVACRSAIRNGKPLTLEEMQTLLDQWQRTRHPRTCPHGRPIYLPLEESDLARFFRRQWVIGKSHGI